MTNTEALSPEFGICVSHTQAAAYKREDASAVNEDALLMLQIDADSAVIAVADGVGGHPMGDKAAALAISCLQENLTAEKLNPRQLREPILDGIEQCNRTLLSWGQGSATTLAVVEIQKDVVRPYHVGDSSIMLCGQRGVLKFQSIAHSPIGLGIEAGLLEPNAALKHEERHWVLNLLGTHEMRIELGAPISMAALDTLLVCSDGLTDNLASHRIIEEICTGPLDQSAVQLAALAEKAMESDTGHPDDLSFILFRLARQSTTG